MVKVKRGATLLITTLLLSVVTIASAAFTAIYFRYEKMNHDFSQIDLEKVSLRTNSNIAFEDFINDTEVRYEGTAMKLRSGLLGSLEVQATVSVSLYDFSASFTKENNDPAFVLSISSENYTINSRIFSGEGIWNLDFLNYERRAK